MNWKSVKKDPPAFGQRCLIYMECKTRVHNCLARNWAYPCCDVNIAYYYPQAWQWESRKDIDTKEYDIKFWMPLPELPNEMD